MILDYKYKATRLLDLEIVNLLTTLHEYKLSQDLLNKDDVKFQSRAISNTLQKNCKAYCDVIGGEISSLELKKLILQESLPNTNKVKCKLAGYRDVLKSIFANNQHFSLKLDLIYQFYKDLHKYTDLLHSPRITNAQIGASSIEDVDEQVEQLCQAYNNEIVKGTVDPLLLIPLFVKDFEITQMFSVETDTIAQLLSTFLLCKQGYNVVKYISVAEHVQKYKRHFDRLEDYAFISSESCDECRKYVKTFLEILADVYEDYQSGVANIIKRDTKKADGVQKIIYGKTSKFTKTEITQLCPNISQVTVQRVLNHMVKSGEITKFGSGRYTYYTTSKESYK